MKSMSRVSATSIASLALLFGSAVAPASANSVSPQAVTDATGGENCSGNQTVHVTVTTLDSTGVTFYRKTAGKYTKVGSSTWGGTHVHDYGTASASWKVVATGGTIKTVSDYCTAATFAAE